MKTLIKASILTLFISGPHCFGQSSTTFFTGIYQMLQQNSFIKAKMLYLTHKKKLPDGYQYYVEATLDNAFNQLQQSENAISKALRSKQRLPDSLMIHLWEIRKDNAIKLYDYKEAAASTTRLLKSYSGLLNENQKKELANDLKLWSKLANVPAQKILIRDSTVLKISRDKAGLKNLKVASGKDSVDFIFDTGANISTIAQSTASKMGMKIIPANIKVGSITGRDVSADLAWCEHLNIGNMEIQNAVFLVFDDTDLAFPQIGYQINGILGFPVIEAMKEITLTRDGYFKVPKKRDTSTFETNMAMNKLIPLIFIEGDAYTFDTGADQTILYKPFFVKNQTDIERQYSPTEISFGGAGGGQKFNGYKINTSFSIAGQKVLLNGVSLLTDEISKDPGIYGNIGQDVIGQFKAITINFDRMNITFQ